MRNSAYTKPQIWNFHATEFFYIFIKVRKIALQSFKMSKKFFEEDWAKLSLKICFLRQSWAKYWEERKLDRTGILWYLFLHTF